MVVETLEKGRRLPFILSLIGGLLIFVAALVRLVVQLTTFDSSVPFSTQGPIFAIYVTLQNSGFTGPAFYPTDIPALVAGVLTLLGAFELARRTTKATHWAIVIIACAFVSLAGTGGLGIGAVLAIMGGSVILFQRE